MHPVGRFLVILGAVLIVLGLVVGFGGNSWLNRLGRLPGDIVVRRENWSFYFPIATSIIVSLILTLLLYLLRK
jgi:hypothetical protein